MVRWVRCHCPPDTGFEMHSLDVWGRAPYWVIGVDGEETFLFFFKPPRPGNEPRTLTWKAAVLTTTLGPPPMARLKPMSIIMHCSWLIIVFVSTIAMITLVISTRTSDKKQCRASGPFFLMASVFVHISLCNQSVLQLEFGTQLFEWCVIVHRVSLFTESAFME